METSFVTNGMHARQFGSILRQITVGSPAFPSRISRTGFLRRKSDGVKSAVIGIDLGTINSCVKCHSKSKYFSNTHCINVRYFGSGNQLSNNIEKEEVISKAEHVEIILKMTETHVAKIQELARDYLANINEISQKHLSNISKLEEKHVLAIRNLTEKHAAEKIKLMSQLHELKSQEFRLKPLVLLAIRSRIEYLEKKFLSESQLTDPRKMKWNAILTSTDSHFVRNEEVVSFRKSVKVATDVFVNAVYDMYGDFSDKGANTIDFYVDCNESAITRLFEAMGMPRDQAKINAIYTLFQPIDVTVRE